MNTRKIVRLLTGAIDNTYAKANDVEDATPDSEHAKAVFYTNRGKEIAYRAALNAILDIEWGSLRTDAGE